MADAPSPPPATDAADVVSPPLAGNLGAAPPVVEAAATTPLVGGPLVVLLASGVTRVGPPLRGQAHHPTTRTALAGLAQVRTAPVPAADASVAEPVVDPALAPLDATAAAAVSYRADDFAGAQVVVRSVIVRAAPAPADAVAVLVDRAARAEQVLLVLDRLAGDRSALVVATRTGPRLLPITIGQPGAIAVEPTLDLDLGWPGELAVELVGPYTGRLARLGVQGQVGAVEFQEFVHFDEAQNDAVRHRQTAAAETRAGAARHDGSLGAIGQLEEGGDLLGGMREHDAFRHLTQRGGAVNGVGDQVLRRGQDVRVPHDISEFRKDVVWHAHKSRGENA